MEVQVSLLLYVVTVNIASALGFLNTRLIIIYDLEILTASSHEAQVTFSTSLLRTAHGPHTGPAMTLLPFSYSCENPFFRCLEEIKVFTSRVTVVWVFVLTPTLYSRPGIFLLFRLCFFLF